MKLVLIFAFMILTTITINAQQTSKIPVLPDTVETKEPIALPTTTELVDKIELANAKINYLAKVILRLCERIEQLENQVEELERLTKPPKGTSAIFCGTDNNNKIKAYKVEPNYVQPTH